LSKNPLNRGFFVKSGKKYALHPLEKFKKMLFFAFFLVFTLVFDKKSPKFDVFLLCRKIQTHILEINHAW